MALVDSKSGKPLQGRKQGVSYTLTPSISGARRDL
jgi:hypothetical protein